MERLKVLSQHVSPEVAYDVRQDKVFLSFRSLGQLSVAHYRTFESISNLISLYPGKTLVLRGDLREPLSGVEEEDRVARAEWYNSLYNALFKLHMTPSCSLVKGLAVGAGAGLALLAKYKVAFSSAEFAFTQNSLGLPIDCGASYILSNLPSKAIGLYLALTGQTITANDAFWCGLVQYYIDSCSYDAVISELSMESNTQSVLTKYHEYPPREQSSIVLNEIEIIKNFDAANSIELILQRLAAANTPFAERTLRQLLHNCPLSLCVSFALFTRALEEPLLHSLALEYNADIQLSYHRSYNYQEALCTRKRPKWYPEDLQQVPSQLVSLILSNPEGPSLISCPGVS